MLDAIRQSDLHTDIRARLETFIREHGLGPGDRLPSEHELVAALGVSRSALREALRSLEALGIVEARHGKGRYLNGFSFDTIGPSLSYLLVLDMHRAIELLEIRRALEVAFLPEAAAGLTGEDLAELRNVLAAMRARRQDGTTGPKEERAFHTALFKRVDNQLLKELLALFWDLMARLTGSGVLPRSRAHNIVDMHKEIVDRIAQGRIPDAVELLRHHYDDLADRLRNLRATHGVPDSGETGP